MEHNTVVVSDGDDIDFLYEVYASSRIEEVSIWGWSEGEITQFLQMQFQFQMRSYEQQYPNLETRIIVYKNEQAGRLLLANLEDRMVIVEITLLPLYQHKGLGTTVLTEILNEAKSSNLFVELSVLKSNQRAICFYEKMGFSEVSRNDLYLKMINNESGSS
ncbi:GNAT family N-acetyltransferase [Bacillus solitudinis]|uniref:GNAT family N-acetyltransferase n=1 Tax=Bacillus solitudinis TaxID=2014074 RepID=UPI000C2462AD|nr:GNAT family N-acetyltransferase [Bacillus solitudinis]